ncbi:MAG: VOC family protein [Acidobacteria bacterium]|nr:VOC family protein [Acidobacteriota bacterium]
MRRIPFLLAVALVAAITGVFSATVYSQAPAGKPRMSIGFLGVGINVSDLARSEKFYTEVFGLRRTFRFPPEGELTEVGLAFPGQPGVTLLLARLNDDPLPDGKSAYGRIVFNTDDARALADRMIAAGSELLADVGPPDGPVILFLSDPDGYQVELFQAPPSDQ